MEHAELIKKLRKERRLSQERLSEGISQRSTLSSFEHSNSRLSFEILTKYLERMNITLEEYEYMLNDQVLNEKREISQEISLKFSGPYNAELGKKLEVMYEQTRDFYYYSLYAQYYLVRFHNGDVLDKNEYRKIARNIKKYLDMITTWGRFELVLFVNCLFVFDGDYIQFQFDDVIKQMRVYKDSSNYSNDLLKFLINGVNLAYSRGEKGNVRLFMNELSRFNTNYKDVKAKLIYTLFKILTEHDSGKNNEKEKSELMISLFLLDEDYWINYLSKYYK